MKLQKLHGHRENWNIICLELDDLFAVAVLSFKFYYFRPFFQIIGINICCIILNSELFTFGSTG